MKLRSFLAGAATATQDGLEAAVVHLMYFHLEETFSLVFGVNTA